MPGETATKAYIFASSTSSVRLMAARLGSVTSRPSSNVTFHFFASVLRQAGAGKPFETRRGSSPRPAIGRYVDRRSGVREISIGNQKSYCRVTRKSA